MYSMIFSAVTNIVLDAIFILGLDMGVRGAGLATVISQVALSVWVMMHITRKNSLVRLKLKNIGIRFNHIKEIFAIGFASFAMHIASAAVRLVQNDRLLHYGDDTSLAAMGIISATSLMIFMALNALNMASQPIIGFNYGAKHYGRVKSSLKIAMLWGILISTFGFLVGELFPGLMIKMFNNSDANLLSLGTYGMRICFSLFPLIGVMVVISSYFQSIGLAKKSAFLSLLRQFIILIPLLIIMPIYFGLDGIWFSWPVSDILAFIVSFSMFRSEYKKLNQLVLIEKKPDSIS